MSSMNSQARSTLQQAWKANSGLGGDAPTIEQSMAAVSELLAPLAAALDELDPDAVVLKAVPGIFHAEGPQAPLGEGGAVKMKQLAPQAPGICATLQDGSVVIVGAPGIPFSLRADTIRQRNFINVKVFFAKIPSLELVYSEDGEMDCLRFSFDDLSEKAVRGIIRESAS